MTNLIERLSKEYGFDDTYILPISKSGISSNPSLSTATDIMPDAKSVLLLVIRHSPFTQFPKTSMIIHSHYPASQKAYLQHKKLIDELRSRGVKAESGSMISLKHYAAAAGLVKLRNSLNYHSEFGSYFSMQAIITDIDVDDYKIAKPLDLCRDCDKCVVGCPTGAISIDGVVEREKCLRHHIPVGKMVPDEIRQLSRRSYIGCGVCQAVCPLNRGIEKVAPPAELVEALDISGILRNDKKQIRALADIIGKNSARPGRVIATACLAAGYLKDDRYLPELIKLAVSHDNPLVREYARWAIDEMDH